MWQFYEPYYKQMHQLLAELGIRQRTSGIDIYTSEHVSYAFVLRVCFINDHYFQIGVTHPNAAGQFSPAVPCTRLGFNEKVVENLKEWLRAKEYPVDQVLRLNRLKALLVE